MALMLQRPWFRAHPRLTLAVAGAMFAAIFAARLGTDAPGDTVLQLSVLPIALLAMAFGRRAGAVAALIGVAMLAAWGLITHVELSTIGWLSRAVPLVLLGVLVGDATDRLRREEHTRYRLRQASLLRREAAEINDSVVQSLAVAKWMLESGWTEQGLDAVNDAMTMTQGLVNEMLADAQAETGDARRSIPRKPPVLSGGPGRD